MIAIVDLTPIEPCWQGAILSIGNFDGVHQGHLALIRQLRALANRQGAPALVVTFDPHPLSLLRPQVAPTPLTDIRYRVELLKKAGVDEVAVFRTGSWLLGLTAREFFDKVIRQQFQAQGLVEGFNFAFGRDRGGNSRTLAAWCAESQLHFEEIPATSEPSNQIISSSFIRNQLVQGQVREASSLLNHPHRIQGRVVSGARRGRQIGFPTANLDPQSVTVQIPAPGVYAAWARIADDQTSWPAAVHIGPNATFGESALTVEAHLLDFQGDLYDQILTLDFIDRVRPTRTFDSVADLIEGIQQDVAQTRVLLQDAMI